VKKVPCEVFSRIVGYLRPVEQWNLGKQQEFKDRKNYSRESFDAVVVPEQHTTPSEELDESAAEEVHKDS